MSAAYALPAASGWRRYRWLFISLAERELKNRYAGSTGGLLWALVHPLLLLGIYALVFSLVFKVNIPELGERPFVMFVAFGLWPWLAFQEGVQRGLQSVVANAGLVKKVAFPHEVLVYAATSATFAVHGAGCVLVLLCFAVFDGGLFLSGLPVMLAMWFFLFVLANALALVLAAVQVFVRDLDQFVPSLMMVLFYATPVLYPLSMLSSPLREVMEFNPLTHFVAPGRDTLLWGAASQAWGMTLLVWALAPLLFWLARRVFLRLSPHFEDFV
jgi:ABC-type polysaccharide/polyol phosphate export permease